VCDLSHQPTCQSESVHRGIDSERLALVQSMSQHLLAPHKAHIVVVAVVASSDITATTTTTTAVVGVGVGVAAAVAVGVVIASEPTRERHEMLSVARLLFSSSSFFLKKKKQDKFLLKIITIKQQPVSNLSNI